MRRAKSGLGSGRSSRPIAGRPVDAPAPLAVSGPAAVPVPASAAATPLVPGPGGRTLALTSVRVGAYITDTVLVSLVNWAVWTAILESGILSAGATSSGDGGVGWIAAYAMSMAVSAAYFVTLWSGRRQTLGMRLFRLEVVRAADGGPVGIPAAVARWAVVDIPALVLGSVSVVTITDIPTFILSVAIAYGWPFVLLGSVAFSPTKRGFHDRAARTSVVIR
jgi:uncharacterized RDD family membrane protein YckC